MEINKIHNMDCLDGLRQFRIKLDALNVGGEQDERKD